MSPSGFLIDENLSPDIAVRLQQSDPRISASAIGQPGMPVKGTSDPDILAWIEENDYWLVTNNRTSMPAHLKDHLAAGRHVPGILIAPDASHIGLLIEELLLVWGAGFPDEFQDRITYFRQRFDGAHPSARMPRQLVRRAPHITGPLAAPISVWGPAPA